MRGVGSTFSRLPAASALVAGAALLTAAAQPGFGQTYPNDDRAMALPRLALDGGNGLTLPQPLEPSEAQRLRHIFQLQSRGAIAAAERETASVDTTTVLGAAMVGHLLADRYLGRFTRPHADELQAWLTRHGGLPDAPDIHALLLARLPPSSRSALSGAATFQPQQNTDQKGLGVASASALPPVPEETSQAQNAVPRNPGLDRDAAEAARRRGANGVLRLLNRTDGLTPAYASLLTGETARILFVAGRDEEAQLLGTVGARACGRWAAGADAGCQTASLPGYVGGLAAWRLGRVAQARPLFERAWRAPIGTSSLRAAAAFWAARAHLASGDFATYAAWLGRAAVERFTFHGQLARRILGLGSAPGERELGRAAHETLGEADLDAVAATEPGLRAFALLQIGQRDRAEAELRLLWPQVRDVAPLARAVMLVADRAGLFGLAGQLADLLQAADGRPREGTRFRVPPLRPDGGFTVDPALVYALARTESNFDTAMVSAAGARGILQILPETASFITAGPRRVSGDTELARIARMSRELHDPAINLDLGQRYVSYLSAHPAVDGDLIRLLVGYNAGPGNLTRWAGGMRDMGDPLLFLESIPADETRAFVPRVLSYTWIFADRLRLPKPSLDALARGEWPRYPPPAAQRVTVH